MKADLTARLHRAVGQLRALAEDEPDRMERTRLLGKAEGIALALDYLRAYPDDDAPF